MAARLNPKHDEATRKKIQTSQLVNRLMKIASGEIDCSATQLRAAEVLLKKVLPDLSAVTMDASVQMTHEQALAELDDR